jgi:glycosyltransferase involved in cell wall biosynthesis
MPHVSVIIPTYNSAAYLVEAIDSVLAQTYSDVEILVIDDGSTDDTPQVIKRYGDRVRYLRQANSGVSVARNRGISESLGRYVAFLDADDTWLPQKLERQMEALAESKSARASNTAYFMTRSDLTPIEVRRNPSEGSVLADLLLRGTIVFISTVVCERSVLDLTGGFDPALSQCADWDMWIRVAAHTDFLGVGEPLVNYRQHDSNMSRNAPLLERDSVRVLEKGFAMAGLPAELRASSRSAFARNYMVLAGTYFHEGHYLAFARCAARAVAMDYRQASYLLSFPARVAMRGRLNHRAS